MICLHVFFCEIQVGFTRKEHDQQKIDMGSSEARDVSEWWANDSRPRRRDDGQQLLRWSTP